MGSAVLVFAGPGCDAGVTGAHCSIGKGVGDGTRNTRHVSLGYFAVWLCDS
jgi:hypothetical protein